MASVWQMKPGFRRLSCFGAEAALVEGHRAVPDEVVDAADRGVAAADANQLDLAGLEAALDQRAVKSWNQGFAKAPLSPRESPPVLVKLARARRRCRGPARRVARDFAVQRAARFVELVAAANLRPRIRAERREVVLAATRRRAERSTYGAGIRFAISTSYGSPTPLQHAPGGAPRVDAGEIELLPIAGKLREKIAERKRGARAAEEVVVLDIELVERATCRSG